MSNKQREALEQIHELLSIGGKPDTAMCIRYEAAFQIAKEALAAPPEPIGNAAKMRKALIIVYDWILKAGNVHGYPDTEQKRRQLFDMMTKALSDPPRNCDRLDGDINFLREACLRERGLNPEEDFPKVFCEWLLEPAKEEERIKILKILTKAEGGNDEQK